MVSFAEASTSLSLGWPAFAAGWAVAGVPVPVPDTGFVPTAPEGVLAPTVPPPQETTNVSASAAKTRLPPTLIERDDIASHIRWGVSVLYKTK